MKTLLLTTITIALASAAAAQTSAPAMSTQERQQTTQSVTTSGSTGSTGAQTAKQQEANVKKSKETTKMTTAEKNAAIKGVNAKSVNPENSAGVAATDRAQQQSTASSKKQGKDRPNLATPEAQKAMQKAATP